MPVLATAAVEIELECAFRERGGRALDPSSRGEREPHVLLGRLHHEVRRAAIGRVRAERVATGRQRVHRPVPRRIRALLLRHPAVVEWRHIDVRERHGLALVVDQDPCEVRRGLADRERHVLEPRAIGAREGLLVGRSRLPGPRAQHHRARLGARVLERAVVGDLGGGPELRLACAPLLLDRPIARRGAIRLHDPPLDDAARDHRQLDVVLRLGRHLEIRRIHAREPRVGRLEHVVADRHAHLERPRGIGLGDVAAEGRARARPGRTNCDARDRVAGRILHGAGHHPRDAHRQLDAGRALRGDDRRHHGLVRRVDIVGLRRLGDQLAVARPHGEHAVRAHERAVHARGHVDAIRAVGRRHAGALPGGAAEHHLDIADPLVRLDLDHRAGERDHPGPRGIRGPDPEIDLPRPTAGRCKRCREPAARSGALSGRRTVGMGSRVGVRSGAGCQRDRAEQHRTDGHETELASRHAPSGCGVAATDASLLPPALRRHHASYV